MNDQNLIRLECPHCGKRLKIKAKALRSRITCPNPACGAAITVSPTSQGGAVAERANLTKTATEKGQTLVDNADGTFSDRSSGLMWQKEDDGSPRTKDEAIAYCRQLRLAGHSDLRLPSLEEFRALSRSAQGNTLGILPQYSQSADDVYWTGTSGPQASTSYVADGTTMFNINKYPVRACRAAFAVPKPTNEPAKPEVRRPPEGKGYTYCRNCGDTIHRWGGYVGCYFMSFGGGHRMLVCKKCRYGELTRSPGSWSKFRALVWWLNPWGTDFQ
jgi:hypothetical protein